MRQPKYRRLLEVPNEVLEAAKGRVVSGRARLAEVSRELRVHPRTLTDWLKSQGWTPGPAKTSRGNAPTAAGTLICWECCAEKPFDRAHFKPMGDGNLSRQCRACVNRKNGAANHHKLPLLRSRAQRLVGGMRQRAKELPWHSDLALFTPRYVEAWLAAQPTCPVCGRRFDCGPKHDGLQKYNSPSLDRILATDGYTALNTALICWRCNDLKKNGDLNEFRRLVAWLEAL